MLLTEVLKSTDALANVLMFEKGSEKQMAGLLERGTFQVVG